MFVYVTNTGRTEGILKWYTGGTHSIESCPSHKNFTMITRDEVRISGLSDRIYLVKYTILENFFVIFML